MTSPITKPTATFWIITVFALLWNITGVVVYISQVTMTQDDILALPAEQQVMYTNVPVWATTAFALATWGSLIASGLLLLRRKLAGPFFVAAFAALLVQMYYSFFIANMLEVSGAGGVILPILIIIISTALIFFTRNAAAKGWLA